LFSRTPDGLFSKQEKEQLKNLARKKDETFLMGGGKMEVKEHSSMTI
jgi:hypothetical protein